ncbi:MAG: cyclic pyranopterin phosphate synthase MoaA [Omnitrophica WOR_2 bacterium GWF2_38_59]|nr:MAG: cyclic pyranopterin phosphate synthase MoaA [Omnitrophica WOR_2 bacterium GWA2_37_7]OGX21999.1 MAG: cyclic pyranopterin phosphate synthase MoaA [Omnitrophica WOR_2 bacterium GWF2_38_59]OGX49925.1 MAG: cyclic pyranopterin phosphate synthase MoaA [Omnitrophica WOR_2 bacterium RIFOXYA2_FULL_38_17]OGX53326.1 MAG: cyclic pyranopterin phosphate synthase MoaA [Omnitrophica WOR_2 bacterium RIFOXYA12_FULL_38_10]OGX55153.1 MAG: cyclic pyranopterin phosphate synthase MoaA [Omnitrophica WOR_2 bacte
MEIKTKTDYLRLSLTDNCNLNCFYCNPLEKKHFLDSCEILRLEEIVRVVRILAGLGISKIRLTGGEPLIKEDICTAVSLFKKIDGIEEVSLTTNGVFLYDIVEELKRSGLDRINISLDTLRRERFYQITGRDCFGQVWQGIEKSIDVGIFPLKLNMILLRGINEDEILDFAKLTINHKIDVRFIELFRTSNRLKVQQNGLLSSSEAKEMIVSKYGGLLPEGNVVGNGPAEYFRLKEAKGTVGFISNLSKHFCGECNRLRMDSAGRIAPCLFSGYLYNVKGLVRNGASDETIRELLIDIIADKHKHNKKSAVIDHHVEMSSVGG